MRKIAVLDQQTIDKIAAGEVVERPSSIVKELVENAIDAGATAVTVEITDGGKKMIRITDNGGGMERDQVPLAFLRHATSKIEKVEDLEHIASLGFRGEALSSIAAVAQVELITKTPSALSGVRCSGGCVAGPSFQMKKGHYLADVLAVKNAAFGKDFHREQGDYELPGFELRKNFGYCSAQEQEEVSEEEIRDALAEMGKFSPKDELNCGACGYNTCREKAIAIIQNKAEVAMCIPYMRAKQESYSNKVFNAMPGLLVTVDYNLKIIQMNEAASKLFNMPKRWRLIGKPVSEIMDDYSLASILAFERNLMQDEIYLEDQKCYLDRVMTNDKENKMILCIMKDITKERKHKDQIHNAQIEAARMADKLVEEQLKIVQQIAGLLGETAADTKVAVEKLKNTILLESEEENEKK